THDRGAPAGGAGGAAPVAGVGGAEVVIGIGVPDLGALKALGANYDWGDPEVEMAAVLDGWKRRGLVPVNGRNVTFVYARYGIFSADEQRAACQSLVVDHHAFAVADFHLFGPGTQCVAIEHHTPLVLADPSGINDSLLQQASPNLFSLPMSESRMLRNWPDWAAAHGYLNGKTLGVYYDATVDPDVADNLLPELDRVGHHPKLVVSTTQNMGGPDDVIAMQKLRNAGVDLVMMNISALNQTNFMQHADAVGYRPAYLENDFEENSDNTATSTFPPSEFDGSYGMAGQASGEAGSNRPVPPATEACVDNYLRYSGDSRPAVGSAKWDNVLIACDLGAAVLPALQGGGRNLTPASYLAAMQSLRSLPMDMFPPVTFGPGKHSGVDSVRTLRWAASCKCWGIVGDYAALMRP
ncbi:MAG TPA: ABC transporter substrate-binding protein, partial [Acidimicrobiales bacterium]|nr:ABC transporter substrate-binding protein [Acidimicrobiales bacterium]